MDAAGREATSTDAAAKDRGDQGRGDRPPEAQDATGGAVARTERVIRVFPRRTKATPDDDLVYIGEPDLFAEADRVEVSVAFSWDLPKAERLAEAWRRVAPVTLGGPALQPPPAPFEPGRYLKLGYTITSRGCPNRCPFCLAWRHGGPHELPIRPGWIVQDDNLLACSEGHIRRVFEMLAAQPRPAVFSGGLEAARLADWHVDLLATLRPRPSIFLAYDTPAELPPLIDAARRLWAAGFTPASHRIRCYVLIGYADDTPREADRRLRDVARLGLTPCAMLYRPPGPAPPPSADWRALQRRWMRPAIIHARRSEAKPA